MSVLLLPSKTDTSSLNIMTHTTTGKEFELISTSAEAAHQHTALLFVKCSFLLVPLPTCLEIHNFLDSFLF